MGTNFQLKEKKGATKRPQYDSASANFQQFDLKEIHVAPDSDFKYSPTGKHADYF